MKIPNKQEQIAFTLSSDTKSSKNFTKNVQQNHILSR